MRLFICTRRHSVFLFEKRGKMVFVRKAERVADLLDAQLRFGQKILRDSYSAVQQILIGCYVKIPFKFPADLRLRQMDLIVDVLH